MSGLIGPKVVAFAALTALATACPAPSGSERLEGRWIGVRAEGTSADTAAAANAFATSTEFDFHRDTLMVTTSASTQSGHYRVVKEDGTKIVITTDRDGPGQTQTLVLSSDETMRWAILEGKTIVLVRQ
jgi:hypothetical protein